MNRLEKLKSKYPDYHYKNVSVNHKFAKIKKQTKECRTTDVAQYIQAINNLDESINKLFKIL